MKKKLTHLLNRSSCKRVLTGQWIKLDDSPSKLSDDQALVICKVADDKLITWVPDYGEYDVICT